MHLSPYLWIPVLLGSVLAVAPTHRPLDIGSNLQLMLDGWLVDEMTGLTFKLHSPTPREIALKMQMPWEGEISFYPVVIKDGGRFRMWYQVTDYWEAYAESDDGIHWTRPNLGILEWNGSRENNLVWSGPGGNMCPFRDGNPDCPPEELYKSTVRTDMLLAQVSPDGIHWRLLQEEPILKTPPFDSHNICFWDDWRREYVAYTRGSREGHRWIRRATSKDFRHWSKLTPIEIPGYPLEQLYTNAACRYERSEGLYLMFPFRLVTERKFLHDWPYPGLSDIVFMWSRDGLTFNRFMEAFMRPGLDIKNWHERSMVMGPGIIQTSPTELSMWYFENYRYPGHIRRATIRVDGFVSVNAPYAGGQFTTKPLVFEGRELVINYSTSAVGSMQVEIQDAEGNPVDGFSLGQCPEIYGDEIEHVVAWEGGSDVSALAGGPVRLRFAMKDADLYSIQFRP